MSTRVASILERPHVRMILAVYSWAGFVASLTVHVGALCGIDLTRGVPAPVITLHAGIFPPFAAAVLALRSELVDVQQRDAMHHLMRRLPLVWRGLFALLFVYAMVNFIVS